MHQEIPGKRDHCIRCGECCLSSSPTLQIEDVSLVSKGLISGFDLYAVRIGELVRDNIQSELKVTDREFIKVMEKEKTGGCIYYDEKANACSIYEYRPIQCSALACWDDSEFIRVYAGPKADRRDIIHDKSLLELMDMHDKKCAYMELDGCVKQIEKEGEKAVEKILDLLKFDYHIRLFISEKLNVKTGYMDLIFGRPLTKTITMFGLKVVREPDGTFFLTTLA